MAGSDSSSRTTPAKGERSWCSSDSSIRRCRFSSLKKSSTVSKVCSLSLTTSANVLPSGFPKNSSRVTFTFAMSHFLRLANVFFTITIFARAIIVSTFSGCARTIPRQSTKKGCLVDTNPTGTNPIVCQTPQTALKKCFKNRKSNPRTQRRSLRRFHETNHAGCWLCHHASLHSPRDSARIKLTANSRVDSRLIAASSDSMRSATRSSFASSADRSSW